MTALQLARLQFGDVTIYHFIFVPITLGITWLVAVFQTLWYRSGDPAYVRGCDPVNDLCRFGELV